MNKPKIDICDFHAHILPGADHGSTTLATSIRQLKIAQKCGVSRIVATPHFYPHNESVDSFIERRNCAYELLKSFIPEGMTVVPGAEVLLCENMENLPGLEKLTVGDSNFILLELPYADLTQSCFYTVSDLLSRGYRVILAHAERYDSLCIDELIDMGAELQINVSSISSRFRKTRSLKSWLDGDYVACIGSDIHGANKHAYNDFLRAVNRNRQHITLIKQKSDMIWSELKAK